MTKSKVVMRKQEYFHLRVNEVLDNGENAISPKAGATICYYPMNYIDHNEESKNIAFIDISVCSMDDTFSGVKARGRSLHRVMQMKKKFMLDPESVDKNKYFDLLDREEIVEVGKKMVRKTVSRIMNRKIEKAQEEYKVKMQDLNDWKEKMLVMDVPNKKHNS